MQLENTVLVEFLGELRRGSKINLPCAQLWVKITHNEIK